MMDVDGYDKIDIFKYIKKLCEWYIYILKLPNYINFLLKTCKYKSRVINECSLRLNLTFVISNESNFGGVPDPISNILGCKTTFPLPEIVTFFRSEALLKVFAKSSTWWHPSNRTDPAFSGSESAL